MFKNLAESLEDEEKRKAELKYCEISILSGEICLQTGDYSLAQNVFSLCLDQVKSILSSDSRLRLIAENYYWLGVTYSFLEMFGEAESHLRSAVALFQDRLINLGSTEQSNDDVGHQKNRAEDEKTELRDRITEMEIKIEELI